MKTNLRPPALAACAVLCLNSVARADDTAASDRADSSFVANGALTLEPTRTLTPLRLSERVRQSASPDVRVPDAGGGEVSGRRYSRSDVPALDDGYYGRISDSFADDGFSAATSTRPAVEPSVLPVRISARPETPAARTTSFPADAATTDAPAGGVILPSANARVPALAMPDPGVAATVPSAGAGAAYPLPGLPPDASGVSFPFDIRTLMPSGAEGWTLRAPAASAASGTSRSESVPAVAISTETAFAPALHRMDAPAPAAGSDLARVSGFQPQVFPSSGAAYAWGANDHGQLGNGTTSNDATSSPVAVSTLTSGVTAITAGGYHGLAIVNGAAYAWGENFSGELGNGTTNDSATPVKVSNLTSGVTAVAGGEYHSLAIVSGAAYAWGRDYEGQLGNGATNSGSSKPVKVSNLGSNVTAIAAGGYFSLAIQNGAAYAWGHNAEGELGNGTMTDSNKPVAVSGLVSGVSAIAAGYDFALAIQNGTVMGWGDGVRGQLGNGTTNSGSATTTPVQAIGLTGVTAIAAGGVHALAVENGNVYAFGGNDDGQLGNGTTTDSLTPLEIDPSDLKNITAVAASNLSSYALSSDGSLWVWGDNSAGELGLGTGTQEYLTPQHLLPPSGFVYTAIDADATGDFADAILAQVPEPATWLGGALLAGAALAGVRGRRFRYRR